MPFSGFSESTVRFLAELSRNNDRSWFEAHREDCESAVITPAKEFVGALGPLLKQLDSKIQAIPRVLGSIKALERRRMGFRRTETPPYKDHLDLWFWSGRRRAWDNSGFYLRLTPDRLILATGMIEFQKETLSRYREHVLDDERGSALATIVDDLRANGYGVVGEGYKKTPRGIPADHPRAALLKQRGLIANLNIEHPKELGTPGFVEFSLGHFSRMAPLHNWLVVVPHP